jgi:hypothetical protein
MMKRVTERTLHADTHEHVDATEHPDRNGRDSATANWCRHCRRLAHLTPLDADTCFGGDHCTVNASGTVAVTGEATPSANTSPGGESVSQFSPANA